MPHPFGWAEAPDGLGHYYRNESSLCGSWVLAADDFTRKDHDGSKCTECAARLANIEAQNVRKGEGTP